MALYEVLLESNAVDVAINSSSTLIAVLHESEVCVYRYNISSKEAQDPILETRCTLEDSAAKPRQVTFRGDSEIFVLLDNEDIGESIVCYKTLTAPQLYQYILQRVSCRKCRLNDFTKVRLISKLTHVCGWCFGTLGSEWLLRTGFDELHSRYS